MSTRLRDRLTAWQHAVEREVAPHVEERWAEAVLLELRLRGVGGDRIGAVLAEVDSHCAESGQSAAEAFGDPATYARSLDLPSDEESDPRDLLFTGALTGVQVLGMLAVLWGFPAWLDQQTLGLTAGHVVVAVGVLALLAVAVWRIDEVLRVTVHHPVRVWFAAMAYVAVLVAVLMLLDAVLLQVPGGGAMALGGALLLAAGIVQAVHHDDAGDDPVRSPLPGGSSASTRASRAAALATRLTPFLIPVLTLVMLVPLWLTAR